MSSEVQLEALRQSWVEYTEDTINSLKKEFRMREESLLSQVTEEEIAIEKEKAHFEELADQYRQKTEALREEIALLKSLSIKSRSLSESGDATIEDFNKSASKSKSKSFFKK